MRVTFADFGLFHVIEKFSNLAYVKGTVIINTYTQRMNPATMVVSAAMLWSKQGLILINLANSHALKGDGCLCAFINNGFLLLTIDNNIELNCIRHALIAAFVV